MKQRAILRIIFQLVLSISVTGMAFPAFADSLVDLRVGDLEKAELRDIEGKLLGEIAAVVVRKDRADAGFILAAHPDAGQPARFVYLPMAMVHVQASNNLILRTQNASNAVRMMQGEDFELVENLALTLADVLSSEPARNDATIAQLP